MNAADVRQALRDRHPATIQFGSSHAPGPWTVIEEWHNIDVLAFSAWMHPPTGKVAGVKNPIVGYEIKVARSDYRRELAKPGKRAGAVHFCNAFYFAVPDGLLRPDELAYVEPEWISDPESWNRKPCRFAYGGDEVPAYGSDLGPCDRGKRHDRSAGDEETIGNHTFRRGVDVRCEGCSGRGYAEKSRVEREAPGLWVPPDVGLVVVEDDLSTKVMRKAPVRPSSPRNGVDPTGSRAMLAAFARWISVRPDPRHALCKDGTMP